MHTSSAASLNTIVMTVTRVQLSRPLATHLFSLSQLQNVKRRRKMASDKTLKVYIYIPLQTTIATRTLTSNNRYVRKPVGCKNEALGCPVRFTRKTDASRHYFTCRFTPQDVKEYVHPF